MLNTIYRRVSWRILPLLFLCYIVNIVDRGNVGFAQLQMKGDLGFSDAVYGLGAGIFFIGYLLFEVPSNLLLKRIGARLTLMRIMVLWGLTSAATMFVTTPTQFYVLRFLLGAFEAGFFPGVVYFLTFWFPQHRRARVVAIFMLGIAASGLISNPLSGWLLVSMDGYAGLQGWQWMFVVEGLPAVFLGILVFALLPNQPAEARWLTEAERNLLLQDLQRDNHGEEANMGAWAQLRQMVTSGPVWLMCLTAFGINCSAYFLGFWTPTLIREMGVVDLQMVGWYAAVPSILGAPVMYFWGRHSDLHGERRWHGVAGMVIGACGLWGIVLAGGNLWLTLAALSLASAGLIACLPVFWATCTGLLSPVVAGVAIAFVTSIANLGGAFSPAITGAIKARTGSLDGGIAFCIVLLSIAVVAFVKLTRQPLTGAVRKPV